ncbi:MAG: putative UDP-N-acetylmuramoylalanyl-D-glutamyl-2,6-diaminopimelate--D-alanyl-D-alanine ligase [Chlamydiota bacterium]|jgi:UDP-N-acetylmuramoyl-tripeptide--D-alanyl-D-alanine ligase
MLHRAKKIVYDVACATLIFGVMMEGLDLANVARHLGSVPPNPDAHIAGYQIDSRLIQPGELFFALPGEKADGHLFLEDAKAKGAVAAVVSKQYQGPDFGLFLIAVEDVFESLQELARYSLTLKPTRIVGVTGSVGKTTTKEFLATILSHKFRVGKNHSSFNTQLTLPITLLNRRGDEEVMVLEMGMSQPGDIEKLIQIAPPELAVLTQVSLAHAAFFPQGLPQIAASKAAIFSHPKTKTVLFYHDFVSFSDIVSRITAEKVTFSLTNSAADYFWAESEGKFVIDERGVRSFAFEVPLKASHIVHNVLAAVGAARLMGVTWEGIEAKLPELALPKMRFETFDREGIVFVNDAYNANPASMKAALANLPQPKAGGKRIGVLGTMKELGPFSETAHREVGHFAQSHLDHLIVVGDEARALKEEFEAVKKPAEYCLSMGEVTKALKAIMSPGDVVLVKGSRSMQMDTVFTTLFG